MMPNVLEIKKITMSTQRLVTRLLSMQDGETIEEEVLTLDGKAKFKIEKVKQ